MEVSLIFLVALREVQKWSGESQTGGLLQSGPRDAEDVIHVN